MNLSDSDLAGIMERLFVPDAPRYSSEEAVNAIRQLFMGDSETARRRRETWHPGSLRSLSPEELAWAQLYSYFLDDVAWLRMDAGSHKLNVSEPAFARAAGVITHTWQPHGTVKQAIRWLAQVRQLPHTAVKQNAVRSALHSVLVSLQPMTQEEIGDRLAASRASDWHTALGWRIIRVGRWRRVGVVENRPALVRPGGRVEFLDRDPAPWLMGGATVDGERFDPAKLGFLPLRLWWRWLKTETVRTAERLVIAERALKQAAHEQVLPVDPDPPKTDALSAAGSLPVESRLEAEGAWARPEAALEEREGRLRAEERLAELLAHADLSDRQRGAVWAHEALDKPFAEIAARWGRAEGTVKAHYHRGMHKLRSVAAAM